jgi:tripartite-type tricarboxylate transporter receptor subunit TctC
MLGAAIAVFGSSALAQAPDYPSRPITFVVPLPPGGSGDPMTRLLADHMSQRLGRPIVVVNKPGAAQFIGSDFVAKSAPDGYTWLLSGQVLVVPGEMRQMKDFDPSKLASIGRFATAPYVVVVPAELPVHTLQEFIAQARATPGKLNYGLVPGGMQLDLVRFEQTVKADLTEVPYNGSAPIVTALLGNQIQASMLSVSAIPYLESGRMRALAATSHSRWSRLPQVPSMGDLGMDFEAGFWYGVSVPAATPQPIQERITRELADAVKAPDVSSAIQKIGMEPLEPSAAEMDRQIQREGAANEAAYRLVKPIKAP